MSEQQKENQLVKGYHWMLDKVSAILDKYHIEEALDHARETAHQIGELSREDAQLIAGYMRRDLRAAADHLDMPQDDLKRWLKFDFEMIEQNLWDTFCKVADKTKLDQVKLNYRLERGPAYKTGQVIGIGSLQCDACGEILHFHKVTHIPPCPKCGGVEYSRVTG